MLNNRGAFQLTESLALKAVSLLLALILWVTILGFKREELKKTVKLEPLLAPGVMITNRIPGFIQLTLSGPRIAFKNIDKKLQPLRPDLRRTRDTTVGLSITDDLLGDLGNGVKVVNIVPQNILIRLEEVIERYVPIRPTLRGVPASGLQIFTKVQPPSVIVAGPRSLIDSLEDIGTEPIDIADLKGTKEEVVSVEVDTAQGFHLSREKVVRVKLSTRKIRGTEAP